MVGYFSVDWLAQSHRADSQAEAREAAPPPSGRPHVPCMVQPRTPAYGEGYLQAKPRAPRRPATCASPGKWLFFITSLLLSSWLIAVTLFVAVSDTSGYSSGDESEAASSECLSVDESGCEADTDGPRRRVRTKFTPEQINMLEKIFGKHKYLEAGERVRTAQKLRLTETQVNAESITISRVLRLLGELQDSECVVVVFLRCGHGSRTEE